jgi:hypothetical protein
MYAGSLTWFNVIHDHAGFAFAAWNGLDQVNLCHVYVMLTFPILISWPPQSCRYRFITNWRPRHPFTYHHLIFEGEDVAYTATEEGMGLH